MKTETRKSDSRTSPACWQREAPCPCLRIETIDAGLHFFPYQTLANATLATSETTETLHLAFASHDVRIAGHNLRSLFLALQDFAVKWIRPMPERYRAFESIDQGVVIEVRVEEAK
jgi:hypothetical protein